MAMLRESPPPLPPRHQYQYQYQCWKRIRKEWSRGRGQQCGGAMAEEPKPDPKHGESESGWQTLSGTVTLKGHHRQRR